MNIKWSDLARMIVYSDQSAALKAANAAMAEALPGYEWHIVSDEEDALDNNKLGLEARPAGEAQARALCPEGVRDAVWARDPDVPDPMLPLISAYIVYSERWVAAAADEDKRRRDVLIADLVQALETVRTALESEGGLDDDGDALRHVRASLHRAERFKAEHGSTGDARPRATGPTPEAGYQSLLRETAGERLGATKGDEG